MTKIPVRTKPLRTVETLLGSNARYNDEGYLVASLFSKITDGINELILNPDGSLKVTSGTERVEGGRTELVVADDNSHQMLGDILKELKIMNLQLAIITDNEITKEDLE